MAHKKKHGNPVPPGNQSRGGPSEAVPKVPEKQPAGGETSPQEQDPKRRLGDFTGTGEHSYQQPGGLNDANH